MIEDMRELRQNLLVAGEEVRPKIEEREASWPW